MALDPFNASNKHLISHPSITDRCLRTFCSCFLLISVCYPSTGSLVEVFPFNTFHAFRKPSSALTCTHSPFISQQSLVTLWSALIGSWSRDFRLVMEVRCPPWGPLPAGLLAPNCGLVAPAGRSGGRSCVRGLDITSREKKEEDVEGVGGGRWSGATCRVGAQDQNNPLRDCS